MRKLYLILAILGFILPNFFVLLESLESSNILFWAQPALTIKGMFANNYAAAFSIDLLWVVVVFFIWSYNQAREHGIKKIWLIWLITMLFGLACGFPLFLYRKESVRARK